MFAKLSPGGLAAFFSLSYIFTIGIYLFGEKLNHWKWGQFISLLPTETCLCYVSLLLLKTEGYPSKAEGSNV